MPHDRRTTVELQYNYNRISICVALEHGNGLMIMIGIDLLWHFIPVP